MNVKCVFSYLITETCMENGIAVAELPVRKEFGKYTISVDADTPYSEASEGAVRCAVFGFAVDVISGSSEGIAREIAKTCRTIDDVVEYEKQLGGKYLLLYGNGEQYYIQGDATCSIPVFYNTEDDFVCSGNCEYIVSAKKYRQDDAFAQIRKSGDISQAMPYDITPYRPVRQLLPNHYLDMNRRTAVRFVNAKHRQAPVSVEEAAETVLPMIDHILRMYLQKFRIYCPITSGRDSRVVLAFLLKNQAEFSCYTIRHPEHNDKTPDLVVPVELCEKAGAAHKMIEDIEVPEALKNTVDGLLGEGNYSQRTLRIAHTIKEHFGDGAIINGDIIGQVGKCSLHRDIPAVFAVPSYFRCKLHNYSRGAKVWLRRWMKEIRAGGEQVNFFDLFSVESRMGRWAGQENLLYNTLGQIYLNIFNSRSIIYTWSAVRRKERKLSALHMELLRKTCGVLTEVPFGENKSLVVKISKSTGMNYLLSSYAKFYMEKRKYGKRMKS